VNFEIQTKVKKENKKKPTKIKKKPRKKTEKQKLRRKLHQHANKCREQKTKYNYFGERVNRFWKKYGYPLYTKSLIYQFF
jgi:hypothetical protein